MNLIPIAKGSIARIAQEGTRSSIVEEESSGTILRNGRRNILHPLTRSNLLRLHIRLFHLQRLPRPNLAQHKRTTTIRPPPRPHRVPGAILPVFISPGHTRGCKQLVECISQGRRGEARVSRLDGWMRWLLDRSNGQQQWRERCHGEAGGAVWAVRRERRSLPSDVRLLSLLPVRRRGILPPASAESGSVACEILHLSFFGGGFRVHGESSLVLGNFPPFVEAGCHGVHCFTADHPY